MTDNAKKFFEAASKDEALRKAVMNSKTTQTTLELAHAHGFELTAEDFETPKMDKISEDEMDAVAGGKKGSSSCWCSANGNGFSATLNCTCNGGGSGIALSGGWYACTCDNTFGDGAA